MKAVRTARARPSSRPSPATGSCQAGRPGKLTITDAKGDVAMVTIADVLQSNGVIHVIDTVLLPM